MRISTSGFFQMALSQMLNKQRDLSITQQQLASGNRLLSPSDDPPAAAQRIRLDNQINAYSQYQRNIDHAQSRLVQSESVLGSAIGYLQRVRELAIQGMNDSLSAQQRASIAFEVDGLLQESMALANGTDAAGEFLYSGFQGKTTPVVQTAPGVFSYAGDDGERSLRIDDSSYVQTNDGGADVFFKVPAAAGGQQDIFTTIYTVANNLRANAPSSVSLTDLDNAIGHLSSKQAEIGARLNVLDNATDLNGSVAARLTVDISKIQDLDYAEAVTRFTAQSTALEASQKAFLQIQDLSLFKYL